MFVIDVIPLAKNAPQGSLTYRTATAVKVGDIVTVPLRKQLVRGIVASLVPAKEVRTMLRTAPFTIRAGNPTKVGALPKAHLLAGEKIAEAHASTLGSVLSVLVPSVMGDEEFPKLSDGRGFKRETIEAPYEKRVAQYIALARAAHKNGGSLLCIAPTLVEVERVAERMTAAGFSPVVLTGALTPKRRAAALSKASTASVVIATPSFLFVPLPKLAGIILERESGAGYLMQARPDLDFRTVATTLAEARKVPLHLGDYPLRVESRPKPEAMLSVSPSGSITLFDARKKEDAERVSFTSVPEPVVEELKKVIEKGGRAAVMAVRKGYAPAVVCKDCGTTVKDKEGRTLSLSIGGGKRVFRSSDGKTILDTNAVCDVCGSWNLLPLGIGVERVLEDLKKAIPNANFVRFDTDAIRTPAQAKKAANSFTVPGTIIIGTEALLPFLDTEAPLDLSTIASADSLLALPFWRARERFVRFALTLREVSKKTILVTRRPKDAAISAALEPETTTFFSEESSLRKILGYPPFMTLLLATAEGNTSRVAATTEKILLAAAVYERITLPTRAISRTLLQGTTLIKVPHGKWPDIKLSEALRALTPAVRVFIDPERLW